MSSENVVYDAVIVGAGVSGGMIANALTQGGMKCLLLEAGLHFDRHSYPRQEVDANAQLYWGGGIELNDDFSIGLLRPKCVGGGSIVNQALMDRFDDSAFDAWQSQSEVAFLNRRELDPWYDLAERQIQIQTVPVEYQNGNAVVFRTGCERNGYGWAPLRRAQRDCHFEDGNCCIECLSGCRIDSKQSMAITVIKRALGAGLDLVPEFEAKRVEEDPEGVVVAGETRGGEARRWRGRRLVLASGAIGNSKLLLASGYGAKLLALGHNFFTHPQFMNLALYDEPINAHRGPLQSFKSDDPGLRRSGFKLENVFAPPVAIAMLLPGFGIEHQRRMQKITRMACIEVAVRDTNPGRIRLTKSGGLAIEKRLNDEDRRRRDRGRWAIRNIFHSTGAKEIIESDIAIGLHLMGGCAIGTDPVAAVVSPEFRLFGSRNVYAADSSVFPNAPGINPSLTIMALSLKAASEILRGAQ